MKVSFKSKGEEETKKIAFSLAELLFPSSVVALKGPLGAGKTQFAKGVASALGIKESVSSPTFNILKCYFSGKMPFYHIDAYRLEDGINIDIGLEEVVEGDGITLIEWPEFVPQLTKKALQVQFQIISDTERKITLESDLICYESILSVLEEKMKL